MFNGNNTFINLRIDNIINRRNIAKSPRDLTITVRNMIFWIQFRYPSVSRMHFKKSN